MKKHIYIKKIRIWAKNLCFCKEYEKTYLYKENENINYKNLYSTLDYLEENQKDIENKLFKNRKTKPSLILYDITSTYVWWEKCELAEYWYSRDNMPWNKQIVIGLVTDNEWNPICIEILKWNTADTSTMVDTIKGLKERFEIESVIMVVDRWMNIEYNLDKAIQEWVEIDLEKFKYITACKKNEIEKKIKSKFDIWLFDKKEYTEIEDKEKRKRYVVMYSKLRIESDKKQRETAIEKTKKAFKRIENSIKLKKTQKENEVWIKIWKWKDKWYVGNCFEYEVKEENWEIKFEYKENEKEIKRMQEYDWLYVLETNIMDEKIKKEDIVRIYKEKDVVEKAFEFIKTDLEIQPLYHYLEKRVKWHIFVCYIAYMIWRRLKEDRKEELKADSFESLITELWKINYIDQYIKQWKQQKDISKIVWRTELAKQLYKKSWIKIWKISSP